MCARSATVSWNVTYVSVSIALLLLFFNVLFFLIITPLCLHSFSSQYLQKKCGLSKRQRFMFFFKISGLKDGKWTGYKNKTSICLCGSFSLLREATAQSKGWEIRMHKISCLAVLRSPNIASFIYWGLSSRQPGSELGSGGGDPRKGKSERGKEARCF